MFHFMGWDPIVLVSALELDVSFEINGDLSI